MRQDVELQIQGDGSIWTRSLKDGSQGSCASHPARPLFVSPWLIVLRGDNRPVVVWRDALPADGFRRLSAIVRWQRGNKDAS